MKYIENTLTKQELQVLAEERFGDMVKCVVDIGRRVMVAGCSLHADGEKVLLENGSEQQDIWGINIYVPFIGEASIEFDSMINIRPGSGNKTRGVEDTGIQKTITTYILQTIQ